MKGVGRRIRISGLFSPYVVAAVRDKVLLRLSKLLDWIIDFRSDTHAENKAMQHNLWKLGFQQVGKVPVDVNVWVYQKLKMKQNKYAKMSPLLIEPYP